MSLPNPLAKSLASYDRALYKFSIPFSFQLCSRYLRGYDLEMNKETIENVKSHVKRFGKPDYLWLVAVSTGVQEPVAPDGIDDNLYEPLIG